MSAVTRAMRMFSEEYPGKFSMGTKEDGEKKTSRVKVWEHSLREIDDEVILNAALHLVTTRPNWPPDIATMRDQCLLLAAGKLQDPTGSEAWERIRKKIGEPKGCENPTKLTDDEKKALDQTASLYDLRHGIGDTLSFARDKFTKAYDDIVSKRRLERLALPEVRSFVEGRAPALPAPESKALPEQKQPDYETAEKIKKLCSKVTKSIGGIHEN